MVHICMLHELGEREDYEDITWCTNVKILRKQLRSLFRYFPILLTILKCIEIPWKIPPLYLECIVQFAIVNTRHCVHDSGLSPICARGLVSMDAKAYCRLTANIVRCSPNQFELWQRTNRRNIDFARNLVQIPWNVWKETKNQCHTSKWIPCMRLTSYHIPFWNEFTFQELRIEISNTFQWNCCVRCFLKPQYFWHWMYSSWLR